MKIRTGGLFRLRLPVRAVTGPILATLFGAAAASADTLTLDHAELLAVGQDPSILMIESRERALSERAVAAGQLPDPVLKVGMVGLPADSLNLGQEPMTQAQVGIMQKIPRGQSRQLRSERLEQRADALALSALDQHLRTLRDVREAYFDVLLQRRLAEINDEAIAVFSDLADITQDYYATGRVQQQDVLRASVELERMRDRGTRISQQEDQARARLATWIGDAAYLEIAEAWPEPFEVLPEATIKRQLENHPRIRALQQEVVAAETGVELAQQNYKPEFGLDLTYGARGGTNPDGRSRPDLLSVMLTMDLPLFAGKRQDREVAASVAESSAAMYVRDDIYRRMRSEVEHHAATLRREQQRLELFESALLPDADFNADATFEAYQAAVETLTTLMRARITEYELQFEYARLQADTRKTRARLVYLQGEPS